MMFEKRTILFLLTFALLASLSAKEGKINIAVLPFENITNVQAKDIGMRLATIVETGLVQSKRFNVIERQQLEKIMKEQGLSLSGFVAGNVEAGKIKGVDAILTGKVTNVLIVPEKESIFYTVKIKTKVEASVKLIDVETGSIKLEEVQHGYEQNSLSNGTMATFPSQMEINQEAEALLRKATEECGESIIHSIESAYPIEGKILKIEGKHIWVSLGQKDGVRVKQELQVLVLSDVLKDPDTGEVIDAVKKVVGELEITRVDKKYSEAKIKSLEKGVTLKPGDKVVTR